ncbi:MAG: hypothetical protein ABI822_28910 [Bryobacteraceae bacterium]
MKTRTAAMIVALYGAAAFPQDPTCMQCHARQSATQPHAAMARAAAPAAEAEILIKNPMMRFSSGDYTYVIARDGRRSKYTVTGGGKTLSADLTWAFGVGSMGQTYLYEYRGALYESQVSFYSALNGLDLTIGHRNPAQFDLELAAGRRVDKLEGARCFGCHTTGTTPGVQCERCHEGAQKHARSPASLPAKLSGLSNEELSDFCGACHRTWQDVQANGPHDINNVRFQPYRLASSKCYNTAIADPRIGCTGCHNPHEEVVKRAVFYDQKCLGCHGAQPAKTCKTGQKDCVSCHMPKVDFPGGHFQFTDHRIRVVRGSTYPN